MRQKYLPHELSLDALPTQFKHIPKPPKQLWCLGQTPSPAHKYVTFVGSRKASEYALQVVEQIIRDMAGFPVVIVSGLAYGIDAAAHRAALAHGLSTIAFPGSGLDRAVLYPHGHHQLAADILLNDGCLISEFKLAQPALPWTFPVRNRLMAGIADIVVIVEAREKSGSLITAREALDYGRHVMIVPGQIYNEGCRGSNRLLYDGAPPLLSGKHLLYELGFDVDPDGFGTPNTARSYLPDEKEIADLLYEPKTRGDLARSLGIPMSELNQRLSEMEMKGLIEERGGRVWLVG